MKFLAFPLMLMIAHAAACKSEQDDMHLAAQDTRDVTLPNIETIMSQCGMETVPNYLRPQLKHYLGGYRAIAKGEGDIGWLSGSDASDAQNSAETAARGAAETLALCMCEKDAQALCKIERSRITDVYRNGDDVTATAEAVSLPQSPPCKADSE